MTDIELLRGSGAFHDEDAFDYPDHRLKGKLVLNLNDAFFWACADCEEVPEDEIGAVADLFRSYGQCGLYYWAFKKQKLSKVEFKDIQRMIDFVAAEEAQIAREPDSNKRAYMNLPPPPEPRAEEGK